MTEVGTRAEADSEMFEGWKGTNQAGTIPRKKKSIFVSDGVCIQGGEKLNPNF